MAKVPQRYRQTDRQTDRETDRQIDFVREDYVRGDFVRLPLQSLFPLTHLTMHNFVVPAQ